jgi:hypothetical protein
MEGRSHMKCTAFTSIQCKARALLSKENETFPELSRFSYGDVLCPSCIMNSVSMVNLKIFFSSIV